MNVLCTGVAHTLILSDKGEVYSIGSSEYGQLGRDVVGGNFHAPVRVVGARANDKGKYYFGEKRIVAISSGDYHCAAVGVDGTLYMWGDASNGKLGKRFMEYYNHDLEMGYKPIDAFKRAEIKIEVMKPSYPVPLKSRN